MAVQLLADYRLRNIAIDMLCDVKRTRVTLVKCLTLNLEDIQSFIYRIRHPVIDRTSGVRSDLFRFKKNPLADSPHVRQFR